MKISETKLVSIIKECFYEVLNEGVVGGYGVSDHMDKGEEKLQEVDGYGISDHMDNGDVDMQERNAQEVGMSDDEVVKSRIDRTKNDFLSRHLSGQPYLDSVTKKYVNSFPDNDWDWHRLMKHDITNNHIAGRDGGDVQARYEKRYGPIDNDDKVAMGNTEPIEGDLSEGMNNNPNYTHYLLNRVTNKIVNGWDYNGVDPADVKYYTKIDLDDMGFSTKDYKFMTKQSVVKLGINPDDDSSWANN